MKALYDAASKLVPAGAVGASTTGSLVSEKREAWTEAHKPEAPTQEVAGTLTKSADERKATARLPAVALRAGGSRIGATSRQRSRPASQSTTFCT